MTRGELLYQGKAKRLYATEKSGEVLVEFTDKLSAFNAEKTSLEEGKGALNCQISSQIFELLQKDGIPTHYIQTLSENEMLCQEVKIIPIEVVVRNIATGSLTRRLGIMDGLVLDFPLVEFFYKDDALGDPMMNDEHCIMMNLVDNEGELEELKRLGREINAILKAWFDKMGLILVDFKVEFGKTADGKIILADEISPDSCRFWDKESKEKLDKDRFREGIGGIKVAYEEVLNRIKGAGK